MKDESASFNQFFNLANELICLIRPDEFFDRVNPAWLLQFGWTQKEFLSTKIPEFLHPEDRPRMTEALLRTMEGQAVVAMENRFRCKDATYKWLSWNAYYLPEQQCVFALSHDISLSKQASEMLRVVREDLEARLQRQATELKHAQRELSIREKWFDMLEHNANQYAMMMLDVEGRIVQWSAGAERMFGYSAQEILGEYFSRFYSAEDIWHGFHHRALRTALSTGRFDDNGLRLRKNGTSFQAHVVLSPIYDEAGKIFGFLKLVCDRSDIKNLKDQLQTLEEQNQRLYEESETGYCESSPDGKIHSCNAAFAEMFGFASVEDAHRSGVSMLFPTSDIKQTILQSLYEHQTIPYSEYPLRQKNGRPMQVVASFFGQFNETGELTSIHGSFFRYHIVKSIAPLTEPKSNFNMR